MASGIRRAFATAAASRFESLTSSSTWREEIDSLREAKKWDEALDLYRRLGKDKDPAIETLILGQKAFSEGDAEGARKHWKGLIENSKPAELIPYLVRRKKKITKQCTNHHFLTKYNRKPRHY